MADSVEKRNCTLAKDHDRTCGRGNWNQGLLISSAVLSGWLAFFHCYYLWFPISFSLSWISGDHKSSPPPHTHFVGVWSEHAGVLLIVKGKRNQPETKQNKCYFICLYQGALSPYPVISSGNGEELPVPPVSKGNLIRVTVALLG